MNKKQSQYLAYAASTGKYSADRKPQRIEDIITIVCVVVILSVFGILLWEIHSLTEAVRLDSQWPR
tara:strand:- start:1330 stop:1527 length:198 start_codon:yes stop_codon:yes gene_type:complete